MRFVNLVFITAITVAIHAQNAPTHEGEKKFSLFTAAGYGFPAGARYVGSFDTYEKPVDATSTPVESRDQYLNIGRGIKLDVGVMYSFLDRLSALLDIGFSAGVPGIATLSRPNDQAGIVEMKYHYSLLSIKVLALPRFNVLDLFDAYIGIGPALAFAFTSSDSMFRRVPASTETENFHFREFNTPAIAWIGSLGAEYPLNTSVFITGDFSFELVNFSLQKKIRTNEANRTSKPEEFQKNSVYLNPPAITPASNAAIRIGARIPLW